MTMTNGEIVSMYRQAAQKFKQIGILADLNQCEKKTIVEILKEAGEQLPSQYDGHPRRKNTKPEAPDTKVDVPDQEIKADAGKPRLTLVPRKITYAIAAIREYGVGKYGDSGSWKTVDKERYRNAAYRHFLAYLDDPAGVDAESGLPHLWHLACNVAFLIELEDLNGD